MTHLAAARGAAWRPARSPWPRHWPPTRPGRAARHGRCGDLHLAPRRRRQTDTWDVKQHTPFETGMKGSELLGTCPTIPTSVDGLRFGEGLERSPR